MMRQCPLSTLHTSQKVLPCTRAVNQNLSALTSLYASNGRMRQTKPMTQSCAETGILKPQSLHDRQSLQESTRS
jgi:hypothetical protein